MADQNGNEMAAQGDEVYGPYAAGVVINQQLAFSTVTPTVSVPATSIARRPGVAVIRIREVNTPPAVEPGRTLIYWMTVATQPQLFALFPNGSTYQLGAGSVYAGGTTHPPGTYDRRGASQVNRLIPVDDDPAPEAGFVLVYIRPVDGVLRTIARFPDGIIVVIL